MVDGKGAISVYMFNLPFFVVQAMPAYQTKTIPIIKGLHVHWRLLGRLHLGMSGSVLLAWLDSVSSYASQIAWLLYWAGLHTELLRDGIPLWPHGKKRRAIDFSVLMIPWVALSSCFLNLGSAAGSFSIDCVLLKFSASPESTYERPCLPNNSL